MPADFIERISKGPGLCAGGYYLELEGRCLGSYKSHIPRGVLDYPEGMLGIDKNLPGEGAKSSRQWSARGRDRKPKVFCRRLRQ